MRMPVEVTPSLNFNRLFRRPAAPEPSPVTVGRVTLVAARPFGWALLVEATVERIELGGADEPLVHYRGRYRELGTVQR